MEMVYTIQVRQLNIIQTKLVGRLSIILLLVLVNGQHCLLIFRIILVQQQLLLPEIHTLVIGYRYNCQNLLF
jgi:hypothetical protein